MVIKINYTSSDVYVSTSVSPVYVVVNYSGVSTGGGVWGQITGTLSNQTDLQTALDDKVPYTGATTNVNLGEFELKAGQMTLDTSPTGTAAVGTTRWNDTIGSSETTLKGGSVILKNGVDLVARVVNKVSPNTTLTKAAYQAVRVSGAQGQRLAVAYAQANNDANSADTIGLVTETIATNQEGFIITVGQIEEINTTGSLQGETWVDGDVLYLSPFTPGAITKVKPTGNGHIVVIGYVEYAHAIHGKIYVKIMNGWELDELHDVAIVSPANNEALIYESSTSLWKNKTIATALGYTPISGSGATGQVAYWNGTNSQTGSNNLFWDNANARLGIGTNTPARALDVRGAARIETASTTELDLIAGGGNIVRLASSATTPFIGTLTSAPFGFITAAVERARVSTNGNLLVGTTSDGGQRLQVVGDAFIKGSGATDATIALQVQNSSSTNLLRVRNDSVLFTPHIIYVGQNTTNTLIYAFDGNANTSPSAAGRNFGIFNGNTTQTGDQSHFALVGNSLTPTSGDTNGVLFQRTFAPTSGTATFKAFNINPTINQTGGANGITRGLYVNPTLTAAADWRSIEWSNNSGWGLYGAGTANNYLGGALSIGTTSPSRGLRIGLAPTASDSSSNFVNVVIPSSVTSAYRAFGSSIGLNASGFTLPNLSHFEAIQDGAFTAGVVTNHYGFRVNTLQGGTNVYAFHSNMPSATGVWNLYMSGTADNYLAGKLLIGTTTVSTFALDVNGTARVSGAANTILTLNSTNGTGYSAIKIDSSGVEKALIGFGTYLTSDGGVAIRTAASTPFTIAIGGGVPTLTLATTGAATFSSSVTAGGGTNNASAILQADSTTRGFLPPRMTNAQRTAISSPAVGLLVYQTDSTEGTYEYISSGWRIINGGGGGGSVDELQVALICQVFG